MNTSLRNRNINLLRQLIYLQTTRHNNKGYTLVIAMAMLLVMTTLLTTAALISRIDTASTQASTTSNQGFFAAEAGLNLRVQKIRAQFEGFNRPAGNSPSDGDNDGALWDTCLAEIGDPDAADKGDGNFGCKQIDVSGHEVFTYVEDLTEDVPRAVTIPINETPFGGLNAQEYRYDVLSVARNDFLTGQPENQFPTAVLGMRFRSRLVPLFQFAAFYDQDMDVSIPPNMTLNGPVHSNGSIFINAAAGATLTITGQVTAAEELYRGEKFQNFCSGTVELWNGTFDGAGNPNLQNIACDGGGPNTLGNRQQYEEATLTPWNNFVRENVPRLTVPEPASFEMPPGGAGGDNSQYQYWDRADLRLVLDLDNNNNPTGISIVNPNGTPDVAATNALDACAVTAAPPTVVQADASGDGTPIYEPTDTVIQVNNAAAFNVGDRIGFDRGDGTFPDLDSNVVVARTPAGVVPQTITIRRQLGHQYETNQGRVIAPGATVVRPVATTSDTFYNFREKRVNISDGNDGTFFRTLDVNIGALFDCIQTNVDAGIYLMTGNRRLTDRTEGGLVWFFGVRGPNSATNVNNGSAPNAPNNYGVRIFNGTDLSAAGGPEIQGLTIVTDQAVYIQGNYNSVVNERPAAIIADSLNVLSEAWNPDDSNSNNYVNNLPFQAANPTRPADPVALSDISTTQRHASQTTIQAAFLSGVDTTGGGNGVATIDQGIGTHGGALNNYPRFHENWTSSMNCGGGLCPLIYSGSMISLGAARRVNGPFCGSFNPACNIYYPPQRNWSFDTDFTDAANLPPMTPRAVYLRQEVFQRTFDTAKVDTPIQPIRPLLATRPTWRLGRLGRLNFQPRFTL